MRTITLSAQRLRNLTTKRLCTVMEDVSTDIEALTGLPGLMPHQIPNALQALEPWLRTVVEDARYFDGKCDATHTGTVTIRCMTPDEQEAVLQRFGALPSPLFG